ncbi:MAG: outer-membrane lipoprotein carrier protein LolA [Xanthobacteraceae bacterium]|nr:outer-membrane lipoprotein carrier protein LolA [Xanthobacteraceae bacterium]QYK44972.1 MAG: outer-membrane lipoprotein carrier protein LolA [Xanthobacteraceae bacterium]
MNSRSLTLLLSGALLAFSFAAPATAQAPKQQTQNAPAGQFDEAQRASLEGVNKFFNSTMILSGKFHQVGPNGAKTEGQFYLQRPGRMRFQYDDPSPIELIADGSSLAVRDRNLATQDLYPIGQTPLRFLLAERIDLLKDSNVTAVFRDELFVTVVINEKSALAGTHRLMLMFGAKDYQLKQWTVTDPQGLDTTVAIYDLNTKKRPDPSLFVIDYTTYRQ